MNWIQMDRIVFLNWTAKRAFQANNLEFLQKKAKQILLVLITN